MLYRVYTYLIIPEIECLMKKLDSTFFTCLYIQNVQFKICLIRVYFHCTFSVLFNRTIKIETRGFLIILNEERNK